VIAREAKLHNEPVADGMAQPEWALEDEELFVAGCDFAAAIRDRDLDDACAAYNQIIKWYPDEQR